MASPSPNLWIRRVLVVVVGLAIGVACVALAIFSTPYHSSPSEVRDWAQVEYRHIMTPTASTASITPMHVELRKYGRKDLPDKIIFTFEDPTEPAPVYDPPAFVPVSPDGSFTLSDGSVVRLAAICMAYPVNSQDYEQIIFDPVTLEIHPQEEWEKRYPEAGRAFELPDRSRAEPMLYLSFDVSKAVNTGRAQTWIFDSRTHVHCSGSSSYGGSNPGFYRYGNVFRRLHDGPITVVSDFFPVLSKKTSLLAKEGETLRIDEFDYEARILRVEEVPPLSGNRSWWSSGPGTGSYTTQMEFDLRPAKSAGEKHTLMMLSTRPGPKEIWVSYMAQTIDGKLISGSGHGGGQVTTLDFPVPPSQIASFQVSYSEPRQRAVHEVKGIPGLPKENQNVSNLFDVRVPYATCIHEHDLRQLLEAYTQLEFGPRKKGSGAGRYPMTFQNARVTDIFQAYLESENYAGAQIDRKQHLIIERENLWDTIREKLRAIRP